MYLEDTNTAASDDTTSYLDRGYALGSIAASPNSLLVAVFSGYAYP